MKVEWRQALETVGGLWIIVSSYLVVFLGYHLIKVGMQRRLGLAGWLKPPLSMQLAFGVWVVKVGILIALSVVMFSVVFGGEDEVRLTGVNNAFFAFGIGTSITGFLCILRVASRPMLGHWPWVSCMICCSFYLLWAMERLG